MFKFIKMIFFLFTVLFSSYLIYEFSNMDGDFSYMISDINYINNGNRKKLKEEEMELPIMYLSISKIGVYNAVYSKDSNNNDIDKNVEIMLESDMPDIINGNVILGGHSGSGKLAYFKDFDLLEIGDEIVLEYDKNKYSYYIKSIYSDRKDGSIVIHRDINKNTLTLFTCNPGDKGSYLVVVSELVSFNEDVI